MKTRVLTGITTTGVPHLGNYVGAIRPAIRASESPDTDAFFFLADYHALVKCDEPERIARSRLEISATWLAAGLDPNRVTFYRQSDIAEIPQLTWMLTCVTGKGLMNRAHAYKGAVDLNQEQGLEDDDGVTMGLFSYPILMAADILIFNALKVPVGRDQVQHLEMARDIAQRFNHLYAKEGSPLFVLPEAMVDESVATLPGLDGRKMSKSYNNTIPLFEGGSKALSDAVARIVTDSRMPGEAKDAHSNAMYPVFQAFAQPQETEEFVADLEGGLSWGEAKHRLVQMLDRELAPLRDTYHSLMVRPDDIEDVLTEGARKARAISEPMMERLREAVGLRAAAPVRATKTVVREKTARLVTYRDEDEQFRLKILSAGGQTLAISVPAADPRQIGTISKSLQKDDTSVGAHDGEGFSYSIQIADQVVAHGVACESALERDALIEQTQVALAQLRQ